MGDSKPSYQNNYAKNKTESAHPELWDDLAASYATSLGPTGSTVHDPSKKNDLDLVRSIKVSSPSLLSFPSQSQPSYANGYARNAAESAYPQLWDNLVSAYVFSLGCTGSTAHDLVTGQQATINTPNWNHDGLDVVPANNTRVTIPDPKINAVSDAYSFAWQMYVRSAGDGGYGRILTSSSESELIYTDSTNVICNNAPSAFQAAWTANKWQSWVVACDQGTSGGNQTLYRDGVAVDTDYTRNWDTTGDHLLFDRSDSARTSDAIYSYFLIYRRKLTLNDVQLLHRDPFAPFRRRITIPAAAQQPKSSQSSIIRVKSNAQPSYQNGYAKNASESAYPNLWDGLVGAWVPLLGPTGDQLFDLSGKGREGTFTNMTVAKWEMGPTGHAVGFDKDTGIIQGTGLTGLNGKAHSVVGGFVCDSYDTSGFVLFGSDSPSSLYWQIANDTQVFLAGNSVTVPSTDFSNGQPWQIGFVSDEGQDEKRIYANGQFLASESTALDTGTGTRNFCIGNWIGNPSGFWQLNGQVSFVYAWGRVVSSQEMELLYADPLAPFRRRITIRTSDQPSSATDLWLPGEPGWGLELSGDEYGR